MAKPTPPPRLACSFCDRKAADIPRLYAGPKANICGECACMVVREIVLEAREQGFVAPKPNTEARSPDLAQRLEQVADHARALLAVAPRCMVCDKHPATRQVPAPTDRDPCDPDWLSIAQPYRCDKHALPDWPDLPQAAAVRAMTAGSLTCPDTEAP